MDADGSTGNGLCGLKVFLLCAANVSHLDKATHL